MDKIQNFLVDHDTLEKGMYISRIDGDIVTYDIRMVKPNTPPYLENAGLHTFEHLGATFLRNSDFKENVIYFGPMGCRTGFYFLARNLAHSDAITLIKSCMNYMVNFDGQIPGAMRKECGNYLDHDLLKAKSYAQDMADVLKNWGLDDLKYKKR
jgi:S-ribosylhomocysteine lyase